MVDKISKTGSFIKNDSTSNSNGNRDTSNWLPLRTAITGFLIGLWQSQLNYVDSDARGQTDDGALNELTDFN